MQGIFGFFDDRQEKMQGKARELYSDEFAKLNEGLHPVMGESILRQVVSAYARAPYFAERIFWHVESGSFML
ncbi:hypothetical protein [Paenibacillus sp. NPDC055715]